MALKLSKQSVQGFDYEYHKIENIVVLESSYNILVSSYKDKSARDSGKLSIVSRICSVPKNSINLNNNFFSELYSYLKSNDFSGSSDI